MSGISEGDELTLQISSELKVELESFEARRDELLAKLDRISISDEEDVGRANAYAADIGQFIEDVGHEEQKATRRLVDAMNAAASVKGSFVADVFVARAKIYDRVAVFREDRKARALKLAQEQTEEENKRRAENVRKTTMNQKTGTAVAVVDLPRMAMPAVVAEKYNLDEDGWRVLVDAVFPLAKTSEGVMMALAYCQQRKLDVFRKCVHLVPMTVTLGDGTKKEIETVWPGIGELRITAQRQSDFFGYDECEFGPDIPFQGAAKIQKWEGGRRNGWDDLKWDGMVPEWAQFTVYKLIHGQRVALKGPKVYFIETYSPVGRWNPSPNERWTRAPRQMLEKTAEAACLRRAWPDVFGDEASFEEMEGKTIFSGATIGGQDATPEQQAAPEQEQPAEEETGEKIVDAEFTSVDEEVAEEVEQKAEEQQVTQSTAKPGMPESRAQWEVFQDNILDKLEDRKTAETVATLLGNNAERIKAAPEDIKETIETAFQARLAKLSGGTADGPEADSGSKQQPPEE